uniref:Serine and arginine rich splicing factor 11 n=1 Tax=Sarcophilus harrisii TaxID=9305 RepID=A0A7N4NTW1_SARHA
MSTPTVVPSATGPGPGPSGGGGPGGGGGVPGGGSGGGTEVIQVTNVSPSASSEQMRTLFGFLGKIDELRLFPPDDSPLPVSSRVCFVKFHDPDSAVVAQHLTNTVFVDRALIVVPYAEGVIPDETKALSLLAPANAVAGLLPGGGLLPTPNPLTQIGAVPLAALGAPALDPALAALGLPGANLNSQSLAADQLLKLMSTVDPKLNHVAAGLVSPSLKSDTSSKEIEEAMKRVREAQSLISAAIEPDKKEEKRRHSRSRSRSRRRRTPSSSRHRRSRSRSRRRSHSKSRSRRRSKSPRRRRSHSRERGRRSRSTSKTRERRRRRSRSGTRSPKKPRSPKRKLSRSPSPRRHKKEKKKDKDKERRDERERSTSKKKKSKDKEKERERKSESDKDVKQVTRDYDEEEQGYDSEKDKKEEKKAPEGGSPKPKESSVEKGSGDSLRESKVNGDDHHEEDMDMSD